MSTWLDRGADWLNLATGATSTGGAPAVATRPMPLVRVVDSDEAPYNSETPLRTPTTDLAGYGFNGWVSYFGQQHRVERADAPRSRRPRRRPGEPAGSAEAVVAADVRFDLRQPPRRVEASFVELLPGARGRPHVADRDRGLPGEGVCRVPPSWPSTVGAAPTWPLSWPSTGPVSTRRTPPSSFRKIRPTTAAFLSSFLRVQRERRYSPDWTRRSPTSATSVRSLRTQEAVGDHQRSCFTLEGTPSAQAKADQATSASRELHPA